MGMFKMSTGDSYIVNPVNPDPYRFQVVASVKVGDLYVSMINYPNCTNFEGNKLLVTDWSPRDRTKIDPHFYPDNGIVARFSPTDEGWEIALQLANLLAS